MKTLNLLMILFLISGCSSYVSQMHNQMDVANHGNRPLKIASREKFNQFRRDQFRQNARSITLPKAQVSSNDNSYLPPSVKRKYQNVKRRYQSGDLVDNDNSASLWAGNGQGSFLFSKNNHKRNGDILILNVKANLKNEISAELARAFPPPLPQVKDNQKSEDSNDQKNDDPAAKKTAEAPVKPPSDAEKNAKADDPEKVYDKISSVVIEEINKDHLLIRGRKDVLYRKSKRTVEIQALVPRRDVSDDDVVESTNIIESNVVILR